MSMRLTTATIERTMREFNAQPLPDDHPLVDKLNGIFGEHTFLIGAEGLHIVDPGTASDQMRTRRPS